jgi:hypothetical protein
MSAPEMTAEQIARAAHQAAAQSARILAAAERFSRDLERRGLTQLSSALNAALKTAIDGKAAL